MTAAFPTHNGRSVDTVEGIVEQVTSTGLKLNGIWFSVSKFAPVELPAVGARVRLQADDKRFLKSIEILEPVRGGEPQPARATISPAVDYLQDIRDLLRAQISTLSSVQLERTSRGVNVSVKCYATDVAEAGRLAEAEYERLSAKYDAS
jgi:hypothetical protein